jgi:hypothetical protein
MPCMLPRDYLVLCSSYGVTWVFCVQQHLRLGLGWLALAAPFRRPRLTMVAYRTVNYLAQPDNVWAWAWRGSGMSLEGEKPDVLLRTPLRCRWTPTLSWIIGREDVVDDGQLMVN